MKKKHNYVVCPKCDNSFNVKSNLKYRVRFDKEKLNEFFIKEFFKPFESSLESVHGIDIVVCPDCNNEFKIKGGYKVFGIFSLKDTKSFIVFCVFFAVIFVIIPFIILSYLNLIP